MKFDNPIYGDGEPDSAVYAVPLNQQSLKNHEFTGERRIDNPILYGKGETNYTLPSDYYLYGIMILLPN